MSKNSRCVVLADRHHGMTEGIRGLLETIFDTVVMVADEHSLFESVGTLKPALAVVDFALPRGPDLRWLQQLKAKCPGLRILVLTVHDAPSVRVAALEAGADGVVLKQTIAIDLFPAIDSVLPENPKVRPF